MTSIDFARQTSNRLIQSHFLLALNTMPQKDYVSMFTLLSRRDDYYWLLRKPTSFILHVNLKNFLYLPIMIFYFILSNMYKHCVKIKMVYCWLNTLKYVYKYQLRTLYFLHANLGEKFAKLYTRCNQKVAFEYPRHSVRRSLF